LGEAGKKKGEKKIEFYARARKALSANRSKGEMKSNLPQRVPHVGRIGRRGPIQETKSKGEGGKRT